VSLPIRGTGLRLGTARRRSYPPLTDAERAERHKRIYGLGDNADVALWIALAGAAVGAAIIIGVVLSK